MKYIFEKKLQIVSKFKVGSPISKLSKEYNLKEHTILYWVRLHDSYGEEGLRQQPKVKPTGEFREALVREVLEKGIPLSHVIITHRVSRSAMESWVRQVRCNGYKILYEEKPRGRPPKNMGRPKKKEPQAELEKLQAENLRLKAENALLKKVKALALKEEVEARLG